MSTKDIPALSLRAAIEPKTANADARTVEVVWTTGARVLRSSWSDGRFLEELSLEPKHVRMGRLNNGAPFLMDHDGSRVGSVAGVVESARLEGKRGTATVRFAPAGIDPEIDRLFEKIRAGIVQNVSVGYRVHKFEKTEGGDKTTPVFRATDWEPYEISAVAMGADDGAGFRSASQTNPCEFPSLEQRQMADDVKTPEQAPVDLETVRAEAAQAERARVAGIVKACRALGSNGDSVAQKLIVDGTALDAARAEVLEQLAQRSESVGPSEIPSGAPVATVTDDNRDKFVRGASAWLIEKSGKGEIAEAKRRNLPGFENVELNGGEFRGLRIVDLARVCCERAGISLKGVYNQNEIIRRAMGLSVRAGGLASTSDFPVLFENVMFKSMRAAYAVQPHTWRRICGTDTVSNFLTHNRFLNGSFGDLSVVPEGAEFENVAIPDGAKVSIATQTYGKVISVTRQMLINDDMGAMADLATRFGASAGLTIDNAVYALLSLNSGLGPTMSDSQPFFHSNRANVSTSAALTAAALDADKILMRKQLDISSNNYLDLVPSILFVPVQLETAAKILNSDAYDPAQTGQKSNSARGMFNDIVSSPKLSSLTRRYLFTAAKEAFKVVFLEGSGEAPVMETEEDFRVDSMSWKVRLDFKAQPYDPKHAVTNAGT